MDKSLYRDYFDPEVLARLDDFRAAARILVDGMMAGIHHSPHKGGSVEFAEYKEYTPGDDLRRIDWKLYGRSDKYYVKQHEDETNLTVYFLVDSSGSMSFQSQDAPLSKLEYISYLVATLAYLYIQQGDRVSAMDIASPKANFVPPSAKKSQLENICFFLDGLEGDGETPFEEALRLVGERAGHRTLLFIFSDFLDFDERSNELLKGLAARGIDMAAFHVFDPVERSLPFEGFTRFQRFETDAEFVTEPTALRASYRDKIEAFFRRIERLCHQHGIDYSAFPTTRSLEQVCRAFLKRRLQ